MFEPGIIYNIIEYQLGIIPIFEYYCTSKYPDQQINVENNNDCLDCIHYEQCEFWQDEEFNSYYEDHKFCKNCNKQSLNRGYIYLAMKDISELNKSIKILTDENSVNKKKSSQLDIKIITRELSFYVVAVLPRNTGKFLESKNKIITPIIIFSTKEFKPLIEINENNIKNNKKIKKIV